MSRLEDEARETAGVHYAHQRSGGCVAGASAQLAKSPIRIGLLPFGSPSNVYDQSLVDAFRSGLRQAGHHICPKGNFDQTPVVA
jgi:hypothetical protein